MPGDYGSQEQNADVVIIGCGPVGAILGNLLGLQGIPTLVLEREPAIYSLPRAVHFDDEVMRLFQTADLAEAVQSIVHVSPGMKFVDEAGRLLLHWPRPQELGPQGWHASYRFHQPELERVLRDGLARWRSVTVRLRSEAFTVEQERDAVVVRYEDLATGRLMRCHGQYVAGCDGARSLVRRLMDAAMEDLGFHERWLVVDALLRRPRPDLGDWSVQYCNKERPATYVRGTGRRRRWEIAVLPAEDELTITQPAKVFELLKRWVNPEEIDVERAVVYTFHSAIATRWRSGRLLIAGDAAHLTPPFLGQGMCAGMRDAGNLAWKLARVLRGQNEDSLLHSYQSERAPHVREYIELAVRLGGLINTKAMEAILPGSVIEGGEAAQMTSIKPRLGPGLGAAANGPVGELAPQPRLQDGMRLDDRVGYRFAALLEPGFAATVPAAILQRLASRDVIVVADDAPDQQAWLREIGAPAVLVRPDRYVFGAANSVDELNSLAVAI